jgi:hypothetical protein
MPRSGWIKPDVDHRLSDHLAFAMLTRVYPPDVVDEVIAEVGRLQRRTRLLPSRIVVYYVLGLALFSDSSYDEVIRLLIAGQSWSSGWSQSWPVPTKAALYKARLRLGAEPLQLLFDRVAKPLATPVGGVDAGAGGGSGSGSGGGFYRGRRLLGMDGISLSIPATAANEAEYADLVPPAGPAASRPSVRVLGLTELGTGAVVGAAIGGAQRDHAAIAAELLPLLAPGQLVLAPPELYSPQLWARAAATGADLVWELPPEAAFVAGSRHPDGSYPSQSGIGSDPPSASSGAHAVRILEHPTSPSGRAAVVAADDGRRYATTLHDPVTAPADELVALLSRRRSLASAFDEFRAHRNSPRVVLRSKIPAGVRQEIYGYLCVHYAMRWIMNTPDAASFEGEFTPSDTIK